MTRLLLVFCACITSCVGFIFDTRGISSSEFPWWNLTSSILWIVVIYDTKKLIGKPKGWT